MSEPRWDSHSTFEQGMVICQRCGGEGAATVLGGVRIDVVCGTCNGVGEVTAPLPDLDDEPDPEPEDWRADRYRSTFWAALHRTMEGE